MIPIKHSTIFKSRWWALLWAAGIIWAAYDFAGGQPQDGNASANAGQPTDAPGQPINSDDVNKLADAFKD